MIGSARRRWSTLDNAAKQGLFVVGTIFAILYAIAGALGVAVGEWAALGAVSAILGVTLALGFLIWLSTKLFPDPKD